MRYKFLLFSLALSSDLLLKSLYTIYINDSGPLGLFNFLFFNTLIIFLGICALVLLIYYQPSWLYPPYLSPLLCAGIVSNTYDRIMYNGVRDYLNCYFFYCNLADIYITFVVALIVLQMNNTPIKTI